VKNKFKSTLKKNYPMTLSTKKKRKGGNKKDANSTQEHYTIHDFNEALYSALREFSSFVNFTQVENATFSFVMDNIVSEINFENKGRDRAQRFYATNFSRKYFVEPHAEKSYVSQMIRNRDLTKIL